MKSSLRGSLELCSDKQLFEQSRIRKYVPLSQPVTATSHASREEPHETERRPGPDRLEPTGTPRPNVSTGRDGESNAGRRSRSALRAARRDREAGHVICE